MVPGHFLAIPPTLDTYLSAESFIPSDSRTVSRVLGAQEGSEKLCWLGMSVGKLLIWRVSLYQQPSFWPPTMSLGMSENEETWKQSKWLRELLALSNAVFQDVPQIPQCGRASVTLEGIVLGSHPHCGMLSSPNQNEWPAENFCGRLSPPACCVFHKAIWISNPFVKADLLLCLGMWQLRWTTAFSLFWHNFSFEMCL